MAWSNALTIGDDPSAGAKKGALKTSYITGFSFYKQNITAAFRSWLHCGSDFKKRVFKPGFSEYGGYITPSKHVLHLIPETVHLLNTPTGSLFRIFPRNIWFNDLKRNTPSGLGGSLVGKEHYKWNAAKPSLYGKSGLNPWRNGTTSTQGITIGSGNWVEIAYQTTIDFTSFGAIRNTVGHTFCVNANMTLGLGDSVHRLDFPGLQPQGGKAYFKFR